jgi:hypothetical protein
MEAKVIAIQLQLSVSQRITASVEESRAPSEGSKDVEACAEKRPQRSWSDMRNGFGAPAGNRTTANNVEK